ncbi:copper amine oxidase N-terminal domain-containing protein [Cohnella fermenti]|uniref:Copper amine oxidase N-terminal domain-containing protein n=1 Tax=Cohnella fermenti TaxID=2565925 RepID=A0A4S4BGE7_9BACL|nr:copper amine oxidase N-terminal domain-containing protein [Cohnella fermenti]THF73395.1 copper amine oxidase N-terminal domain-containing protein [Cohnella fermenti]
MGKYRLLAASLLLAATLGGAAAHADEQTDVQADEQTDVQADVQTDVQADVQTDVQAQDPTAQTDEPSSVQPVQAVQAGTELFVAYVYASQRAAPWLNYATAAANAGRDAQARASFGLATAEEVQTWTDAAVQAREQLQLARQSAGDALSAWKSGYSWGGSPPLSGQAAAVDPSLAESLRLALAAETKAAAGVEAATLKLRAGMIKALQTLPALDALKQAKLSTIGAKEAYVNGVLAAYASSAGSPMSLSALLEAFRQGPIPVLYKEAISALSANAAPILPAGSKPASLTVQGETYVPLRLYAESLGYRVQADSKTGLITLTSDDGRIVVDPNRRIRIEGDEQSPLAAKFVFAQYAAYVTLPFFPEVLGMEVAWSEADRQVIRILPIDGKDGSP